MARGFPLWGGGPSSRLPAAFAALLRRVGPVGQLPFSVERLIQFSINLFSFQVHQLLQSEPSDETNYHKLFA
jgi:hypothetical protein